MDNYRRSHWNLWNIYKILPLSCITLTLFSLISLKSWKPTLQRWVPYFVWFHIENCLESFFVFSHYCFDALRCALPTLRFLSSFFLAVILSRVNCHGSTWNFLVQCDESQKRSARLLLFSIIPSLVPWPSVFCVFCGIKKWFIWRLLSVFVTLDLERRVFGML